MWHIFFFMGLQIRISVPKNIHFLLEVPYSNYLLIIQYIPLISITILFRKADEKFAKGKQIPETLTLVLEPK